MKLIIAGGRDFDRYNLLVKSAREYIGNRSVVEIVSGKSSGADLLGEWFAADFGYPVKEFPADWNKYGKSAGPIRNKQMAAYATDLLVFWDGKSKGTKNMIDEAKKLNLNIRLVNY